MVSFIKFFVIGFILIYSSIMYAAAPDNVVKATQKIKEKGLKSSIVGLEGPGYTWHGIEYIFSYNYINNNNENVDCEIKYHESAYERTPSSMEVKMCIDKACIHFNDRELGGNVGFIFSVSPIIVKKIWESAAVKSIRTLTNNDEIAFTNYPYSTESTIRRIQAAEEKQFIDDMNNYVQKVYDEVVKQIINLY